jgi:hypothetical protein
MRSSARFFSVAALVCAGATLVTADAHAVGTRTFRLDSIEELSGGDLRGVAVGSDGVVRAGWTLGSVPVPAGAGTTATCAIGLADGSVLLGTGPSGGGKVIRVANDQATVFADTKESAVSALAVDRAGTVYAATTSGKIYRVTSGKADVYTTLPGVESIFALAVDKAGTGLFAGTGSDGAVVRIEPGGASSVYFKTEAPFVVSLAVADDGAVYAGTGGKGLLYRIAGPGRASVLYDFHGEDVHAVAVAPGGRVYAIANEGAAPAAGETSESSSQSHRSTGGRSSPGPSSSSKPKAGKGALWRFDAQGRPERMMHHDDFHYVSLAVDDHGVPYVGTGAEGRVYTVDDAHTVSLVADTDERQITALGLAGRTRFALGSDPATLHRVLGTGGPDAVWTSKALDAGLRARFGHLTWRGAGSIEVSSRSGDTQSPDSTWSPWSAAIAEGGAVPSPAGRYVQVRARLKDGAASLSDVALAFRTENLRAVVTEISAHERGGASDTKEGIAPSGGSPGRHESVVRLTWKIDNPDEDELRYRVQFRRDGETRWIDATHPDDVVTKAELDWDTSALPEGRYRVRVQATDEIVNPLGDVTEHALESAPVLVDNAPPVFKSVGMQGRRLRAEVVDGLGPIVRIEVAVDGRAEWRPLASSDGLLDTADETVDTDLTALLASAGGAAPHIVAVRAFDAAGNSVVREVEAP